MDFNSEFKRYYCLAEEIVEKNINVEQWNIRSPFNTYRTTGDLIW